MIYRVIKNGLIAAAIVAIVAACSDDILVNGSDADKQYGGMSLDISVMEQADMIYDYGQTRGGTATQGAPSRQAIEQKAYPLEGGDDDLYVHRMPLPFVGIHPHSVSGETSEALTRASLSEIASDGINFHDSLSIWGFTSSDGSATTKTLLNSVLVQKINGWRTACEWPYGESGTMKFYAIAPAIESIEENITITNKASVNYTTVPTFTYKVPATPAAQRDLVLGQSEAISISSKDKEDDIGQDNKTVAMTFTHLLTAVRFAQGKMPTGVTIKRIKLNNIQNQGTYNGSWGSLSGAASYTIYPSFDVTAYNPENVYIDGDSVLFLMPQTLAEGASMEVVLRKDGEDRDRTLTCAINGDIWTSGYTVTYKITIGRVLSDYYLVIDTGDSGFTKSTPDDNATTSTDKYTQASGSVEHSSSATGSFTVHSFRNRLDYSSNSSPTNKWTNVTWKIAGFADAKDGDYAYDNTSAGYVSDITLSSNSIKGGGTTHTTGGTQSITYSLASQAAAYTGNHKTILTSNYAVSSFNLSTHLPNGTGSTGDVMTGYSSGNIYNSANSYIVNAQGSYVFPLVYGNSYQNGSTVVSNPGNIFLDHAGHTIANANIIKQVNSYLTETETEVNSEITTEESAGGITKKTKVTQDAYGTWHSGKVTTSLIWEDCSGLVTGTSISTNPTNSTVGYIGFEICSTPQPGNALIALMGQKERRTIEHVYKYTNGTDDTGGYTEYEGTVDGKTYPYTSYADEGSEEVLWTWHIWCTDEVYPNRGDNVDQYYPQYNSSTASKITTIYDTNGVTSLGRILPVNQGWVPDELEWHRYAPREVWVKLVQTVGTPETAYIKLRKEAVQELITGTSTVYQWGRPTALPMVYKINKSARSIYNSAGSSLTIDDTFKGFQADNVQEFLKYPTYILRGSDSDRWWPSGATAYWNSSKTLYDPCPPGFQVPNNTLFSFISLTGANLIVDSDGNKKNIWTDCGIENKGAWVYATKHATSGIPDADRYGPVVYFPASGQFSGTNASETMLDKFKDQSRGHTWTYGLASATRAYQVIYLPNLKTNSSNSFIFSGSEAQLAPCYALPIRPMAVP